MFVNLHALPYGQSMYTLFVTIDPEGTASNEMTLDELDVVAPRGASWGTVATQANLVDEYGLDARVIGVVDQSAGEVIFDAFAAGIETGEYVR